MVMIKSLFCGLVGISLVAAAATEVDDTTSLLQVSNVQTVRKVDQEQVDGPQDEETGDTQVDQELFDDGIEQELLEVDLELDMDQELLVDAPFYSSFPSWCPVCTCSKPANFWIFNGCSPACGAKCDGKCCCIPGMGKCPSKAQMAAPVKEAAKAAKVQMAAAKTALKKSKAAASAANETIAESERIYNESKAQIKELEPEFVSPSGCPVCTCNGPSKWKLFNGCWPHCGAKCGSECCCIPGIGDCPNPGEANAKIKELSLNISHAQKRAADATKALNHAQRQMRQIGKDHSAAAAIHKEALAKITMIKQMAGH